MTDSTPATAAAPASLSEVRRRRQERCAARGHTFPDDTGKGSCTRCKLLLVNA